MLLPFYLFRLSPDFNNQLFSLPRNFPFAPRHLPPGGMEQLVVRLAHNQEAVGSNPTPATKINSHVYPHVQV